MSTLLLTTILVGVAATANLVPFELRWVAVLGMLDSIRKAFKMNTEAVGLVLRELDFHIPFWPTSLRLTLRHHHSVMSQDVLLA